MSVLSSHFDSSIDQFSPIGKDYERVVNYDEDGNEYVIWREVDYPSLQASLGLVSQWSLNSLLSAGIDPSFPIHTVSPSRLDSHSAAMNAVDEINSILDSDVNSNSEN